MSLFSPGLSRKIEIAANVIIIFSGLLIAIKFIKPEWLSSHEELAPKPGTRLSSIHADWSSHDRTLVLALQVGCRFCSESAPFYQQLTSAARQSGKVHLLAVLPQRPSDSKNYLATLSVPVEDVRQATLSSLNVSGTPTLILVNRQGVIQSVWVGKLSSGDERQVLGKLGL